MKLVIDIGNTNTKIALFEGKELSDKLVIRCCDLKSVQEFVFDRPVTTTIVSSVKKFNSDILSVIDYYNALIFSQHIKLPIKNLYKTPETIGLDRLSAVIGAHLLYPKNDVIVFDVGTCLTVDIINRKGEYVGGRISPGIEMRYKALHTFTDKLPLVKQVNETPFIGNDTNTSIISGVQQGVIGEIRLIIEDFKYKIPDSIAVITGGDCFFFEKELKNSIFANPNLVLIGLNEILDINE